MPPKRETNTSAAAAAAAAASTQQQNINETVSKDTTTAITTTSKMPSGLTITVTTQPEQTSSGSSGTTNKNTNTNSNINTTSSNSLSAVAAVVTTTINNVGNTTGSSNSNTIAACTSTPASTSSAATAVTTLHSVYLPDIAAEQRTIAYQANAKLCRLVRKCPWMYDRNHNNYGKKHILDKSWTKISNECNDSVASCKERWRNIRAAFARSINIYKTHSGPNRVKPYYLHKELSFLVKPMMDGRDKKDEFDEVPETTSAAGIKDDPEDYDAEEEEEDEEEEQAAEDEEYPDETAEIRSAFEALNPDIRIHTESEYRKMLRSNNNNNNNMNNNNNVNNNNNNMQNNNNINNNNHTHNAAFNNINNHDFDPSRIFEPQTEFTTPSDNEQDFHFPDDTLSQAEAERRVAHMLSQNNISFNFKRPSMQLDGEQVDIKRIKLNHNHSPPSAADAGSVRIGGSEADLRFLEALLPDMALMNTRQKIVFKRKIYQTLEEVFENSNDFPHFPSSNDNERNHNHHHHHQQQQQQHNQSTHQQNMHSSSNFSNTSNNSNNSPSTTSASPAAAAPTASSNQGVRQTVLTVNSPVARTLINNIANLNDTELQKVNGFLQNALRPTVTAAAAAAATASQRTTNGPSTPSSAAARLMHSTPKITITKITCPPPASLRNHSAAAKPQSPTPNAVTTTIHNPSSAVTSSNVHSTTAGSNSITNNKSMNNSNINMSSSSINSTNWTQMCPITIKDEVEDVDID